MYLFKQSDSTAANRKVLVYLVDSTDGWTPETSITVSAGDIKISKNGAAEANHSGTWSEVAGGLYTYEFATAELGTVGILSLRVAKTGCRQFVAMAYVGATGIVDLAANSTVATAVELAAVDSKVDDVISAVSTVNFYAAQIESRIPAALVGGRIDANVGAISTDATAADNAEAFFDGTGYAGTNNVIPLVTTTTNVTTVNGLAANVITAASIATDAIGASELAADAVAEIQSGLATASALTTVDTVVDSIYAQTTTISLTANGIDAKLPAALVSGKMDSSIGALQAGIVASIQSGLATASAVSTVSTDVGTVTTNLSGVQTDVNRLLGGQVTPFRGKMGSTNETIKFNFGTNVATDDVPTLSAVYYREGSAVIATGVTLSIIEDSNYDGFGQYTVTVALGTTNLQYGDHMQVIAAYSIDAQQRKVIVGQIDIREAAGRENVAKVIGDFEGNAFAEESVNETMFDQSFFDTIAASGGVTVTPIQANVVDALLVDRDIVLYEDTSSPNIVWSVLDGNNDPIDLSGKTVRFLSYDINQTTIFTRQTGGSGITIGGASNNQVTMTYTTTNTANAKVGYYELWNDTDTQLLQTGKFTIKETV